MLTSLISPLRKKILIREKQRWGQMSRNRSERENIYSSRVQAIGSLALPQRSLSVSKGTRMKHHN